MGRDTADEVNKCQTAASDGGRSEDPKGGRCTVIPCSACEDARTTRWNPSDSGTVNSKNSSANNACVVCRGSLRAGMIPGDALDHTASEASDRDYN